MIPSSPEYLARVYAAADDAETRATWIAFEVAEECALVEVFEQDAARMAPYADDLAGFAANFKRLYVEAFLSVCDRVYREMFAEEFEESFDHAMVKAEEEAKAVREAEDHAIAS